MSSALRPATRADAARLAELGLPVFPCTMAKAPMTVAGFKDAIVPCQTSPLDEGAYPYPRGRRGPWPSCDTLIGVPTGAISGLVVIDVDTYKIAAANGDDRPTLDPSADWLAHRADLLNTARIHRTGSGGYHYVFRVPRRNYSADEPPIAIRSRAGIRVGGKTLPYVDVRADGGYVIWWAAHGCTWSPGQRPYGPRADYGALDDVPDLPVQLLDDLLESCRETSVAPSADAAKRDEFVRLFQAAELYRREKAPGVHCVTCPWIEEHPNGKQSADDTAVYFEPHYNGRSHSAYVCKDAACDGKRTLALLRAALTKGDTANGQGVVADAGRQALQAQNDGGGVDRSETDAWIARIETTAARKEDELTAALLASWTNHLMRSERGAPLSTPKNTLIALGYAPETFGAFVYDEFCGVVTVTRDLPHMPHMVSPFEWQDDLHWMPVASWLNRHGIKPDKNDVCDAVRSLADLRRRNSAREYFESLRWDSVERLSSWLRHYLGAEGSDEYLSRVGTWFLMGVTARACQPGAKQDYTLVLVMKQGVGKTTVAETLAVRPEWFTDRVSALGSKDSLMELRGRLIVEMAELEVFRKSDVETQKAFLTSTVDKYRAPYGRSILAYPRTCCFVGTTNEAAFLHDLTGNRRFWPVKCGEAIDVESLRRDLGQLYAEAYARWQRRERYWPAPADNPIMEREQERYRIVSPLEEQIVSTVCTSPPVESISNDDLYGALGMHDTADRTKAARQLAAVMRKLGYEERRWREGNRQLRGWTRVV